ncbi:hypothetical protein DL93DRAFT_2119153 [Clavulina sp. PMI_390]|nr:hypothetical protein DL93DRAFT_2119153 [Clavulina sp. PMI_390]
MMRTCYEGNFSYLDDDLQSLVTELETLRKNKKPGESLAHSIKELLEQRKPRIDSLIKEGRELEVWHDVYKANLKYDRAGKEDDRADEIENRLQELGWSNEDISAPHRAPEFEKMLIQPTALSESIWRRIRPRLEEILSERKELRLAEEAREEREIREKSIIKGLQMIAKLEATRLFDPLHPTCPTPLWVEQSFAYGASHLPGGLSSLPSLLPLMELSIGPLVDGFGKAYGQIREDLRRTQKKARHSLAQLIRDAESGTPSDDAWAFGEADLADDELDAVDAENLELLLRPSSLFCVPCHHKTVGYKLVGYPRVLRYAAHLDHHTTVGRLAKMLPVASAMMVAFDLEAESQITLSYEDLRFSCGSCPEHVGCTYSWARLVEHYIQEQDWFHIQEEQNLARGVPWFNPHQSYRAKRLDGYEQAIEYLTEVEYRYTKDKSAPIWGCTLCPKRSTHGDPRFCAETVFLAQFPMKKEALLSHLLKRSVSQSFSSLWRTAN